MFVLSARVDFAELEAQTNDFYFFINSAIRQTELGLKRTSMTGQMNEWTAALKTSLDSYNQAL